MKITKCKVALSLGCLVLAGCASSSENIQASYVSPLKYNSYTCPQMGEEYARVLGKSMQVNKRQDDTAGNDSVAMGVGLVLFWPALFFIASDDQKEDVANMKGNLNAIEEISIKKNCSQLSQKINSDRKEEIERIEKEKHKSQQEDNTY
ncbi:MAG: metal ABC transporter ATP-binding protein [Alphaproteobacteria bacterium]